jgi:carboxypeptidase Q
LPLPPAAERRQVERLRDAALKDDIAWDIVEGLTTEVGPRLAGTEAEARARDWAVRKLKALGFSNVRVEEFDMPVWVRGEERAEIVPLPAAARPDRARQLAARRRRPGIEAEVVALRQRRRAEAAPARSVRGKIVFVTTA